MHVVSTWRLLSRPLQVNGITASFFHQFSACGVCLVFVAGPFAERNLMTVQQQGMHAGPIHVIAWAVRQKQNTQSAGCEIFLITLECNTESASGPLSMTAIELLQVSLDELEAHDNFQHSGVDAFHFS